MARVFIALGSNLGDRTVHLAKALGILGEFSTVVRRSPVYETAPMYLTDQPRFLNMVVQIDTDRDPRQLLALLKQAEKSLGREGGVRYGPRVIDLDILLYDDQVVNLPNLKIPHPGLPERAYVLRPLCDIAPHLIHPVLGRTMERLLSYLPEDADVQPFGD